MTVITASQVPSSAPTPTSNTTASTLWTKDQIIGALERGVLAAIGSFTAALAAPVVVSGHTASMAQSAVAAGIGAGVAFSAKLGTYLTE